MVGSILAWPSSPPHEVSILNSCPNPLNYRALQTSLTCAMSPFHALIRTHHITSRKKVGALRAAARDRDVVCLLRSGGVPGLMYVRGSTEGDVQGWVDTVHGLRYKDYKLVAPTAPVRPNTESGQSGQSHGITDSETPPSAPGLDEVGEVKEFGKRMEELGLREWWRAAMGFAKDD